MFPKKDRPDFLMEDSVIDSLPTATVANVVSQHKMTQAIERQNALREEKTEKSKGGLKKDQNIKMIKITEGEDNSTTVLHKQRFLFRTPLLQPEAYWESYPVKWPEVNKKIHLLHLGLDHVISAKTLEMIHDRSDPTITIKMFSNINVMMGREGLGQMSRLQQYGSYIELESKDNWLEVASISQLEEALDNLNRPWTVVWPGEYGPANLRGVISKHVAFRNIFETRKKVLEDFINRVLADNAVRAGQKLPPLSFMKVDERAKDLIEIKKEIAMKKIQTKPNQTTKLESRSEKDTTDFNRVRKLLGSNKETRHLCGWFNSRDGGQASLCSRKHLCGKIAAGQKDPCLEKHSMNECDK